MDSESSFKIQQNVDVLLNYTMQKAAILDKIKNTFLFPYLINMKYMVGTIENVKITENPIDELGPYLSTLYGINRTLKVNLSRESLIDWEIFKHEVILTTDEFSPPNQLNIYILLRIIGNQLDLLIFGIMENKIFPQEKIIGFLDTDIKIVETKKELGLC